RSAWSGACSRRNCCTIQSDPCLWSNDAVWDQAMIALESAHFGLCFWSEVAVYSSSGSCLHLLNQFASCATTERGPTSRGTHRSRWLTRRDQYRGRGCTAHDRGNG